MSFISFSCLIVLAKISSTMLNRNVRMNIFALLPILGGTFTLSLFSMMIDVDFSNMLFIKLKKFLLFLVFWEFYFYEEYYILSNIFFCIYWEKIIWLFFFSLLIWWITLIDFWMLNLPCISKINSPWLWCIILSIYWWIWLDSILLRVISVHKGYSSVVFFSCGTHFWFWYQGNSGLIKWFGKYFLLCSILQEFV